MLHIYPDYYKTFECIADKCPDTCCAGWQIVIDEKSLENYRSCDHSFKKELTEKIDWKNGVFKQDGCRRCAFLNNENLCDLYTAMGEENLCYTCTNYPRHIEEFENVREHNLSISCPEVARLVLEKRDKVTFYSKEDDESEEYEEFDFLLYGILQEVRENMIGIMQDRQLELYDRMVMLWNMAEDMQQAVDDETIFQWESTQKDYITSDRLEDQFGFSLKMFQGLYRWELLNEEWGRLLDETALVIYGKGEKFYNQVVNEFKDWLTENMPQWKVRLEQLVVYYLTTYMCGAVYDGYVASKVKLAVVSGLYIYVILCGIWLKNNKHITFDDVVEVVYRYSRELEHSDINLGELEEFLDE